MNKKELYIECLKEGYKGSFEEFNKDLNEILKTNLQELQEEEIENVAGGMNEYLKKGNALALSMLTMLSAPIGASAKTNNSGVKNIGTTIKQKFHDNKDIVTKVLIGTGIPLAVLGAGAAIATPPIIYFGVKKHRKNHQSKPGSTPVNNIVKSVQTHGFISDMVDTIWEAKEHPEIIDRAKNVEGVERHKLDCLKSFAAKMNYTSKEDLCKDLENIGKTGSSKNDFLRFCYEDMPKIHSYIVASKIINSYDRNAKNIESKTYQINGFLRGGRDLKENLASIIGNDVGLAMYCLSQLSNGVPCLENEKIQGPNKQAEKILIDYFYNNSSKDLCSQLYSFLSTVDKVTDTEEEKTKVKEEASRKARDIKNDNACRQLSDEELEEYLNSAFAKTHDIIFELKDPESDIYKKTMENAEFLYGYFANIKTMMDNLKIANDTFGTFEGMAPWYKKNMDYEYISGINHFISMANRLYIPYKLASLECQGKDITKIKKDLDFKSNDSPKYTLNGNLNGIKDSIIKILDTKDEDYIETVGQHYLYTLVWGWGWGDIGDSCYYRDPKTNKKVYMKPGECQIVSFEVRNRFKSFLEQWAYNRNVTTTDALNNCLRFINQIMTLETDIFPKEECRFYGLCRDVNKNLEALKEIFKEEIKEKSPKNIDRRFQDRLKRYLYSVETTLDSTENIESMTPDQFRKILSTSAYYNKDTRAFMEDEYRKHNKDKLTRPNFFKECLFKSYLTFQQIKQIDAEVEKELNHEDCSSLNEFFNKIRNIKLNSGNEHIDAYKLWKVLDVLVSLTRKSIEEDPYEHKDMNIEEYYKLNKEKFKNLSKVWHGLDLNNVSYLHDIVFNKSINELLWTNKPIKEVKEYLDQSLLKFENYAQLPTVLKEDSRDFTRICNALEHKGSNVEELKNILGIKSNETLSKTDLLEKIKNLDVTVFEKALSETLKILPGEKIDDKEYEFASETGFSEHDHFRLQSRMVDLDIDANKFRSIMNIESRIKDPKALIFKDKFYEKEAKDLLKLTGEAKRDALGVSGAAFSPDKLEEIKNNLCEKWFKGAKNKMNTDLATYALNGRRAYTLDQFFENTVEGSDILERDNIFLRSLYLLNYLMKKVNINDIDHLNSLEKEGKLNSQQKLMKDCLDVLTGVFNDTENKCDVELLDMGNIWYSYLEQCAKQILTDLDSGVDVNASDNEKFMYNISSSLRKQAMDYMIRKDRSVVNSVFGVETKNNLQRDYNKVFNIQSPTFVRKWQGFHVVESMTNRKRAENASEMLNMGELASLTTKQIMSPLFRSVLGDEGSIAKEANAKERSFKDFINIIDELSLRKSLELNASESYENDFKKFCAEYKPTDDEKDDFEKLKLWVDGKKNLNVNEINRILLENFDISQEIANENKYFAIAKLLKHSVEYINIYWSLPCYMVDTGYISAPNSK